MAKKKGKTVSLQDGYSLVWQNEFIYAKATKYHVGILFFPLCSLVFLVVNLLVIFHTPISHESIFKPNMRAIISIGVLTFTGPKPK